MPKQAEKPRSRTPGTDSCPPIPRPVRQSASPGSADQKKRPSIAPHDADPLAKQPGNVRPGRRRQWIFGILLLLALAGAGGWARWRAVVAARMAALAPKQDPEEARLRRAADPWPNDPAARWELGRYYEDHARPFEALCEYAEVQRLQPAHAELPAHMAAVLDAGHIDDLAIAQLVTALRARPDDLDTRRRLADLYLNTAEPLRARRVMEERRSAVWQDAESAAALGRALQACGDTVGAVAAFNRSLALDRQQYEAWYRLGRLHLENGQSDKAQDGLFHSIAANRSRPEHFYYTGISFLQRGKPGDLQKAIDFFKQALALKPSYGEAHYQYGAALERMGQRQEAVSQYEQAVLADFSLPEPNLALGRALALMGHARDAHRYLGRYNDLTDRPAQAAREFRAMAALGPKSVQPALLEGQIHLRTQQAQQAVAVTEAALTQHPDDIQLLERLAMLKINRGDRPYARRLLNHWLELKPKATRPLWLLARCDFGDLKYADGIEKLEKAIKRQPRDADYWGFLGGGYLRMETPDSRVRAAETLAKAIELAPESGEYRDLHAQSLRRLGRIDDARAEYLRALDYDPYRISCYTPVAQLSWRLNRPGAAGFFPAVIRSVQARLTEESALWSRVWTHPQDADAHLKLARFLCRTADLKKARYQLEQALELRPGWPEAKQLLATVRRAQEAA